MSKASNSTKKRKSKVVIIGGGLAGMTLAMGLIRKDKDCAITVIKKEKHGSYSPCGMPFVLEGKVERMEDIILNPPEFYTDKGIVLKTESEVTEIDLEGKMVTLDGGEVLNYNILVIATGRKPFIPPVEGVDLEGVYTLSNYEDGIGMKKAMENAEDATIIGGGIIGLETAIAFAENDIRTTVIEMLPTILPQILDPDMASLVRNKLESNCIDVLTSTKVSSINGDRTVESVVMDERQIKTDLVLIATGVRPNVDLAKNAGVDIGKTGGLVVNSRLNVKKEGEFLEDVFALGDCVEVKNKFTNSSQVSALASTAALQGRIVAENICGGNAKLDGYLSPAITVIGDLHVGSVGLTSHTARQFDITTKIGKVSGLTRSRYCPDRRHIHIKLLVHDGQLIGAQIISEEDVKERINSITLAIQNGMTIDMLLYTERSFTPPLSPLTDPFIRALENFKKENERR